jgi:hypothetical protein
MTVGQKVAKDMEQSTQTLSECEVDAATLVNVAHLEAEVLMRQVELLSGARLGHMTPAARDLSPFGV